MNLLDIITHSAEETRGIGLRLGELAKAGDVILLSGGLGVGKTCLTQGIAWGLGITGYATSPTFVVINEYRGRLILYHIDLYRIDKVEEIAYLGLDDYLYGQGICVVEWAEKALSLLPKEHLLVKMHYLAKTKRNLRLEPQGQRYDEMLTLFRKAVFGS